VECHPSAGRLLKLDSLRIRAIKRSPELGVNTNFVRPRLSERSGKGLFFSRPNPNERNRLEENPRWKPRMQIPARPAVPGLGARLVQKPTGGVSRNHIPLVFAFTRRAALCGDAFRERGNCFPPCGKSFLQGQPRAGQRDALAIGPVNAGFGPDRGIFPPAADAPADSWKPPPHPQDSCAQSLPSSTATATGPSLNLFCALGWTS